MPPEISKVCFLLRKATVPSSIIALKLLAQQQCIGSMIRASMGLDSFAACDAVLLRHLASRLAHQQCRARERLASRRSDPAPRRMTRLTERLRMLRRLSWLRQQRLRTKERSQ